MSKYLITWRTPKKLLDGSELVKETIEAAVVWQGNGMFQFLRPADGRNETFRWVAQDLVAEMEMDENV